jgi:AcrR family transcriptional regulator
MSLKARTRKSGRPGIRPRSYHHGNLRRALLDAALRLLKKDGSAAPGLREVARMAGVSQAAPYRHFADKQDLLAAVAEEGFRTMTGEMRRAGAPFAGDPIARLQAIGIAYVEFASRHPAHFRVMFEQQLADRSKYPDLVSAAAESYATLTQAIAACHDARVMKPGDPIEHTLAAWSIVHGLASLIVNRRLETNGKSAGELARDVTRHLTAGIGAT